MGVPSNWGEYPEIVVQGYQVIASAAVEASADKAADEALLKQAEKDAGMKPGMEAMRAPLTDG